jgi:hypothetical protein
LRAAAEQITPTQHGQQRRRDQQLRVPGRRDEGEINKHAHRQTPGHQFNVPNMGAEQRGKNRDRAFFSLHEKP